MFLHFPLVHVFCTRLLTLFRFSYGLSLTATLVRIPEVNLLVGMDGSPLCLIYEIDFVCCQDETQRKTPEADYLTSLAWGITRAGLL